MKNVLLGIVSVLAIGVLTLFVVGWLQNLLFMAMIAIGAYALYRLLRRRKAD